MHRHKTAQQQLTNVPLPLKGYLIWPKATELTRHAALPGKSAAYAQIRILSASRNPSGFAFVSVITMHAQ